MGIKPMIFVLLFAQNCLSYPIDGQDSRTDAESSQQFSNDFSMDNTNAQTLENFQPGPVLISSHRETRQYISEMEPNQISTNFDYLNIGESNMPTYFGNHRPIGRPPRPPRPQPQPPMDIPDDVEVFSPPGPSRPISPPKPIPVGPTLPPDVETFWPINGKPVQFPKGEVFGSGGDVEMLPNQPIVFERERIQEIPEYIESDIRIVPKPMSNKSPVMMERDGLSMTPVLIEKQGSVILEREQPPQMMPVYLENGPPRITPTIIEKIDRPVIIEEERPRMIPFRENERVPIIMEKEVPLMSPVEQSQMTFLTENERNVKSPTEFRPIPQVLPERFKRDNQILNDNSETINLPSEKESDQAKEKSVVDNEISTDDSIQNNLVSTEDKYADYSSTEKLPISNESGVNSEISVQDEISSTIGSIFPTTTSTIIDTNWPISDTKIEIKNERPATVENNPMISPQSVSNEPIKEISTAISTLDSTKILYSDDSSLDGKLLVSENSKYEQPPNSDISTSTKSANNNIEEKISTTMSTLDSTKILNDDDSSLDGKLLVSEDSEYEQPSNLDISNNTRPLNNTINGEMIATTSTSTSTKKIEDVNRNLETEQPLNSHIASTIQVQPLKNGNDGKIIASTSTSTSEAEIEDLNKNLATKQPLNSDIFASLQPSNKKNDEKVISLTSTSALGTEIKNVNGNLAPGQPLDLDIPSTIQQPNKMIDEKKNLQSPMTTSSNADREIETPSVNSNLATSEGVQSTIKPAEISTTHPISSTEEMQVQLTERLITEVRRLLEDIKNQNNGQNIILDQHPIGLQNINHPSIPFDATKKTPPVYYTSIDASPNPLCIYNGNGRGPIVFPHSSCHQVGLPDIPYHVNNELSQLLGGILDIKHDLQSLPVSHGVYGSSNIIYPYNNLHYPVSPFSSLSMRQRRTPQDHWPKHN